ncbi:MAG TPA: hypothetical protein VFZ66_25270 [Herpetosiphonaceae bacterium]
MDIPFMWALMTTLRKFRRRERWTRAQVLAYRAHALQLLREHAYAHSPFYQQFHADLTDRPLGELPVLTKAMLMEHFDEVVTDRGVRLCDVEMHLARMSAAERFQGRYVINATSGSTGRRAILLFDPAEWITILASFARAREWAGMRVNLTQRVKTAIIASTTPWHMSAQVGVTVHSWWMPELRIAATEPLESIVERLNTWQPEVVVAYASMARILAEEQRAGRLRIAPRRVFTSSEVLTDTARRVIEDAWGKRLFDQYGATETGDLAAECAHHRGLHLFEDLLIAEVVDHENRLVPPGAYGEKLLVTTLWSRTLPLIRYELSDSVRLSAASCPCGRPFVLIDGVQGRTQDILYFATPTGGEIGVHPHIFHRILDMVPASGWQVVQEVDRLEILLSGLPESFEETPLVDAIRRVLEAQRTIVPPISVRRVAQIPKSASGKAPLVMSHVPRTSTRAPTLAIPAD